MAYQCSGCEFRVTDDEYSRIRDYNETCPACRMHMWKNFKHKDLYAFVQDHDYVGEKSMKMETIGKLIVKLALVAAIIASIVVVSFNPTKDEVRVQDSKKLTMEKLGKGMMAIDGAVCTNIKILDGIHYVMTNRNAQVDVQLRDLVKASNVMHSRVRELEAKHIEPQVD